jgi:hypothetical protein
VTVTISDDSSLTFRGTGDVKMTYMVFVRDGVEVAELQATLHFSDLDPEFHQEALCSLRRVALHLAPTVRHKDDSVENPTAGYRDPARVPKSEAPAWWQFWRRAP